MEIGPAETEAAAAARCTAAASEIPAPPPPSTGNADADAETYESTHVHAVYEAIAPHFSSTRHKPWPRVSSFLASLPPGAVGLDVGCGNGKYLPVNRDLWLLGSDRSANLIYLARDNDGIVLPGGAGKRGDGGQMKKKGPEKQKTKPKKGEEEAIQEHPEQSGVDTLGEGKSEESPKQRQQQRQTEATTATAAPPARRNEVLVADSLSLPYRPSSADFAISIAVLHHLSTSERRRLAVRAILDCLRPGGGKALLFVWALEQRNSRRGWDEGATQDQLVSWVTKGGAKVGDGGGGPSGNKQVSPAEKRQGDGQKEEEKHKAKEEKEEEEDKDSTWHRYYHLYKKGELDEDIRAVGGVVVDSGYERDNWWAICTRGPGEWDV